MNKPFTSDYNIIMYDTLKSYVDVLMYPEMSNKGLRHDLIQIKDIVDEWLKDVEIDIEMEEE